MYVEGISFVPYNRYIELFVQIRTYHTSYFRAYPLVEAQSERLSRDLSNNNLVPYQLSFGRRSSSCRPHFAFRQTSILNLYVLGTRRTIYLAPITPWQ
jgi:hypothetical protein